MFDAQFWVAVAFCILIGLIAKPVGRALARTLDARSARIARELEDAVRLREEAQEMLALYQNKYQEIARETEEIIEMARCEAKTIQKQAQDALARGVEARLRLAEEKIAQEEQKALRQVRREAVALAIEAARDILREDRKADEMLIRLAASEVSRVVH